MVDTQSFNATEFFDGEPNLPTILESDEQRSNLVSSPPASPESNKSNAEEPKSNTATTLSNGSNTPDVSKRKNTTGFLQTENHEMKPIREPLTSANFIHIGVPGEINFPSANIRELTIGVFHIFNPTENQISWSLTPVDKAMFRR